MSGWLTRFARDTRANTMAIVGISLIPLAGMVGGGVDISRMYIVKTRLQHACDAGALAGRKQMGGGTWAYNDYQARDAAENFFNANIRADPYGATALTSAFTESAGRVSGTATATLPMTIMRIFGKKTETINVTCSSEMRLPNTDVMFVLDVTGSMAQKAVSTDTDTKIEGLRKAVKCFYEIVARLDTDADCDGGAPSGGTGSETQIRFGFVPYDMNVNVGRVLDNDWVADRATYQSRQRATIFGRYDRIESSTNPTWGGYVQQASTTANNSTTCNNTYAVPADEFTPTGAPRWPDADNAAEFRIYVQYSQRNWRRTYNSTTKVCALEYRDRTMERRTWYDKVAEGTAGAVAFPAWAYGPTEFDVSGLKTGSGWNQFITLPIGNDHTDFAANWDGCIEERETVRAANYWPIPAEARDLDIDTVPSTSDPRTQWKPALNTVIYPRKDGRYTNSGNMTRDTFTVFNQTFTGEGYTCPTAAKKLQAWPNAADLDNYVDNMWGGGNTYHDIGMIWGARLMSPDGIFAAENKYTPQGAEIERHLIFMTDGEACTENYNYQAYGVAFYDRRQTDEADVPTDGCNTTGTITQQVNARTAAVCSAVKNKNITLWVIWFGASNTSIEGRMRTCASTGRFFTARNSAALQQTFRSIANQISQLRLTS